MSGAPETPVPALAELLRGLAGDMWVLMHQELALARQELRGELRKGKDAVLAMGFGIGIAAVGGGLLIRMVVHLLQAGTSLPLWACEGIVGGGLFLLGALLLYRGREQIVSVNVVPPQTVATLRENLGWMRKKGSSSKK